MKRNILLTFLYISTEITRVAVSEIDVAKLVIQKVPKIWKNIATESKSLVGALANCLVYYGMQLRDRT